MRKHIFIILLASLVFAIGCSGASNDVAAPAKSLERDSIDASSHMLWGYYQFIADPVAGTLEITPMRGTEMHLNALPFLEPPAFVHVSLESLEINGNTVEADIGLRHPFLGLTEFSGFDVCGILISDGSISGFSDAGIVIPGAGDVRLLNPDGYSRWWNPSEFPAGAGMFGYQDGMLGTPDSIADFSATVNGYKYFCDDLDDPDGPLSDVTPESRGLFNAGQKNIRHYTIDITPGLVFNYAVDANWVFPQGDPPWTAPDDFSLSANRPEAWWIDASITNNTLWNDGNDSGGALSLDIDVYDRQNMELNTVNIESPGNFTAQMDIANTGTGADFSTYEVDITDATPAYGEIEVLISVVSEDADFAEFLPGTNTTAYQVVSASVESEPADLEAFATVEIEPFFDGFGPTGASGDPIPTEWYLTLDASASTGAIVDYLWEMNGDDLFDDASGMIVSAGFPDPGTHVIKLKITNGASGEDVYELPDSYEVVQGTYVDAAFGGSPDGSRANPYTSILTALDSGGAGGYVLARGDDGAGGQNPYASDLDLGAAYDNSRIQGYYGNITTDEPPMFTGLLHTMGSNITFDGFEVTGSSSYYYSPFGHRSKLGNEGGVNILFRHLYIHDINNTANLCKAILAWSGGDLVVQNVLEIPLACSYEKNQSHYGSPYITFENCTFDRLGTDSFGFAYYRSGGTGFIDNCIWTDIGTGSFFYIGMAGGSITVNYTCTSDTPTPPDGAGYYNFTPGGTGLITTNPTYVDPYSDHHLQSGSPCINTGDPSIADYDGSVSDMGCYGGPYGDWDFEN